MFDPVTFLKGFAALEPCSVFQGVQVVKTIIRCTRRFTKLNIMIMIIASLSLSEHLGIKVA